MTPDSSLLFTKCCQHECVSLELGHVQCQDRTNGTRSSVVGFFFFLISTALIRQEPLCSTAHLINEEQPCALADTAAHTFECKTLGSSRLCGRSRGYIRAHNNTHVLDILLTAHCPFVSLHRISGYPKLLCIRAGFLGVFLKKNHYQVSKVHLVWWGLRTP